MIKTIVCISFIGAMLLTSFSSPSVVIKPDDRNPKTIAEENVEAYVRKKFGADASYKLYNFGNLFKLKKQEVKELDELIELRKLVPSMKDHYGAKTDSVAAAYDTLIAQKQRAIAASGKGLPDYIISHIFSIKTKKDGSGTVYECDFILNDKLEVKDLRIKLAAELAKDDFDWFYYFFQKYPIFNSGNYDADVAQSNQVFDYYNARLARLKEGKEEFLVTALRVTRIINKTKKYDPDIICGFLVMKRIDEKKICENYRPIKFSPSEEIRVKTSTGDSLIGYKIFHKYECTANDGKTETKAMYAELDSYFSPAGMLPVEAPFDKYFEKKE
ncbi:MAG TPA: hypothetical protein VK177_16595 [Flavobacteriales bacterium]|nr:hypothetical protein [Flavobacteriales bacterium]